MAHNLEMVNGEASFASFRQPAWHHLGTVFNEEVTTSQMLSLANLNNWNVRVEDVPLPENYSTKNPSFWVVRNHPETQQPDVLATVGKRYTAFQNEDLFAFGDTLLDGGRWETAGSIKNGRVVFGSLALDREIVLDPDGVEDKINTYLMVTTSHDGSLSIQAITTPVRVVCQNTHTIALRQAKQSFKVRHTQTVEGKVQQAREALNLAHKYLDEFESEAKQLIETEMTKAQFDKVIALAYPEPDKDTKGSLTKWQNKVDVLQDLYFAPTNKDVANTAWGVYNAMTERLDWYRGSRGNAERPLIAASGLDLATNNEKQRLLDIVKSVAA
jgi:phage/plasmid-like protein (TIGR03299 family)